mmetsp:Transcript_25966/g.72487  ORF Transcript_25966/g.72487 Transcript_25966/m.72487 type:complete len:256 (+) Transcript_25966:561-1328(+)
MPAHRVQFAVPSSGRATTSSARAWPATKLTLLAAMRGEHGCPSSASFSAMGLRCHCSSRVECSCPACSQPRHLRASLPRPSRSTLTRVSLQAKWRKPRCAVHSTAPWWQATGKVRGAGCRRRWICGPYGMAMTMPRCGACKRTPRIITCVANLRHAAEALGAHHRELSCKAFADTRLVRTEATWYADVWWGGRLWRSGSEGLRRLGIVRQECLLCHDTDMPAVWFRPRSRRFGEEVSTGFEVSSSIDRVSFVSAA